MKRIYLDMPLTAGHATPLNDAAFHYICRVLRCRNDEPLILFNGDGYDYAATLQLTGKKSATVTVGKALFNERESPLQTILLQGLSKGERMDIAIQKAVELGVNAIYPIKTEFCAVKLDGERLDKKHRHWQAIIQSACEQCGRATLPQLQPLQALSAVLPEIHAQHKWVLHPYAAEAVNHHSPSAADEVSSIALLIGPEGGLSDNEVTDAVAQGFVPTLLGKRILRTETASIAALSIAQQLWGDFYV